MPVTRSTSCNGTYSRMSNFPNVQVKSSPEGLTQTLASSPGTLHDLRRRPQGMVFLLKIDNTAPMRRTKLTKSYTPLELRRAAHNAAQHLRNMDCQSLDLVLPCAFRRRGTSGLPCTNTIEHFKGLVLD